MALSCTRTGPLPPELSAWRPWSLLWVPDWKSQPLPVLQTELKFIERLLNYMAKGRNRGKKKLMKMFI